MAIIDLKESLNGIYLGSISSLVEKMFQGVTIAKWRGLFAIGKNNNFRYGSKTRLQIKLSLLPQYITGGYKIGNMIQNLK